MNESIIKTICEKYSMTPEELSGKARLKRFVAARKELSRLAREAGMSNADIGRYLVKHPSVISYYLQVKKEK